MPEGILFRFANEEMVYLLRSLHITNFPGVSPEPLKQLTDEEKSLLMMEADHTLRARGLVHWSSATRREVDPLITKLLLECAHPAYTLFVDMLDAGAAASKLLYIFGTEMTVEQCEAEPQVQQYLVIPSREAVSQRLQALMLPEQKEASDGAAQELAGGLLSPDLWKEALKMARTDEAGVRALLARSLPRPTAEALAASLHDFQRIRYLGLWKQTPTSEQSHPEAALTFVAGHGQSFLLWLENPAGSSLNVLPADARQIREYLNRLTPAEQQMGKKGQIG